MGAQIWKLQQQPGAYIRRRLDYLTAIRFFAALYVVLYHFSGAALKHSPRLLTYFINQGHFAVDLFFVLSGFVLTYNYSERMATEISVRLFFRARLARIYPAYSLAMILAVPAVFNYSVGHYQYREAWIKSLAAGIASATMIQAWIPRLAVFWNFPGWSVSDEMFFYLCFPLLVSRTARYSDRTCLVAAALCLALGAGIVTILVAVGHYFMPRVSISSFSYFPVIRLPEFIIGMLAGRMFLNNEHRDHGAFSLTVSGAGCVLIVFGLMFLVPSANSLALECLVMATPFAALIYILARCHVEPQNRSRPTRFFVLLGDASYSMYILQWPIFYLCGRKNNEMTWLSLLLYIGLLAGISILVLKLFEEPLRKALTVVRKPAMLAVERPVAGSRLSL